MAYHELVASLTLVGSALSCVGSTCIIICLIIYRRSQRSFRHALIFNLALSDLFNSFNNTISGAIYVAHPQKELRAGAWCTLNGWVGQLSVQATDFSILAISIATLLVVTQQTRLNSIPMTKRVLLCMSVWVMPLISSTTVTALGEMKPVSGNWCWISKDRKDLRYGLAHGWRMGIMIVTILIYVFIYQYLTRHFRSLMVPSVFAKPTSAPESVHELGLGRVYVDTHIHIISQELIRPKASAAPAKSWRDAAPSMSPQAIPGPKGSRRVWRHRLPASCHDEHAGPPPAVTTPMVATHITPTNRLAEESDPWCSAAPWRDPTQHYVLNTGTIATMSHEHTRSPAPPPPPPPAQSPSNPPPKPQTRPRTTTPTKHGPSVFSGHSYGVRSQQQTARETIEAEIKRMLLLNGYPTLYILLWVPGLANRVLEASGRPASGMLAAALNCSTQFVGLANALTYGLNREMRQVLGRDLKHLFWGGARARRRLGLGGR